LPEDIGYRKREGGAVTVRRVCIVKVTEKTGGEA